MLGNITYLFMVHNSHVTENLTPPVSTAATLRSYPCSTSTTGKQVSYTTFWYTCMYVPIRRADQPWNRVRQFSLWVFIWALLQEISLIPVFQSNDWKAILAQQFQLWGHNSFSPHEPTTNHMILPYLWLKQPIKPHLSSFNTTERNTTMPELRMCSRDNTNLFL